MVQILVVNGEATHTSHLGVRGLVQVLAHQEHRVVQGAGGTLGRGIHTHDVHNGDDGLQQHWESVRGSITKA